jgi:hypothetical protein
MALMTSIVMEDVVLRFPGPFGIVNGVSEVLENVLAFCSNHAETSVFFPGEAFAIDVLNKTVAAVRAGTRDVLPDRHQHVRRGALALYG